MGQIGPPLGIGVVAYVRGSEACEASSKGSGRPPRAGRGGGKQATSRRGGCRTLDHRGVASVSPHNAACELTSGLFSMVNDCAGTFVASRWPRVVAGLGWSKTSRNGLWALRRIS